MAILGEIKKISTTRKNLRSFGITLAIVLLLFSAYFLWKDISAYRYLVPIAGVLIVTGWLIPFVLKPIYRVWMTMAVIIGFIITTIFLGLLFYIVVTPIGLISRLFGREFLALEWDAARPTYWNYRKEQRPKEDNLKQF